MSKTPIGHLDFASGVLARDVKRGQKEIALHRDISRVVAM